MAVYAAVNVHHWHYGGNVGEIECLCGAAVLLCSGGRHNCPLALASTALSWPICKFCTVPIKRVIGATPVYHISGNPLGHRSSYIGSLWSQTECDSACPGYDHDGMSLYSPLALAIGQNPKAVYASTPVMLQEKVEVDDPTYLKLTDEELAHRRIIITERVQAACAIAKALGHEVSHTAGEHDFHHTTALKLKCDCGEGITISMETRPVIASKGPAIQFRCKGAEIPAEEDCDDGWSP